MTQEEMEVLYARYRAMSKQVDAWFIEHSTNSKKGQAALVAMLEARQLSEDLLTALMQESTEVLMLRTAWREVASDSPPELH